MEIRRPDGGRTVPIHDFYISAGKVDLKHGELLTSILIKKESYENMLDLECNEVINV